MCLLKQRIMLIIQAIFRPVTALQLTLLNLSLVSCTMVQNQKIWTGSHLILHYRSTGPAVIPENWIITSIQ